MNDRKRVLLVDDRDPVRSLLRATLTGFDCVFTEAEDGASALSVMASMFFDAIFLDLRLPGMSGMEVLAAVREQGIECGKIIILTGYPDQQSVAEALALGAFRYLFKGSMSRGILRGALADALGLPTPPDPPRRSVAQRPARSSDNAARRTVLVVDSDPESLETTIGILGAEFDPIPARDGDDALKKLLRRPPTAAVIDVNLAGPLSAFELLTRMRKSNPTLRAIMVADELDADAVVESVQRGALRFVLKERLTILPETITRILDDVRTPIRVFLCYARNDVAMVSRLYYRLTKRGFLPWMDIKSIGGGADWDNEAERAIDKAHYFVFCVSPHSVDREGPMRKELRQALRKHDEKLSPFVIPVRLERCPIDPSIPRLNHIDLFKSDGFEKLIAALST